MLPDRNLLGGVGTSSFNNVYIALGIKEGIGDSTSDLEGTWYFYTHYDEKSPDSGDAEWFRGTVQVDATGTIIGGTGTDVDGLTDTITGGQLSVNASGEVSFQISFIDAPSGKSGTTNLIERLQMSANKQLIGGVIDNDDVEIAVFVKAGGNFATV